ncbi:hypothetical protein JTB14_025380 [Gonioctena quinquepunctata]|nr:hypothetical protein JTB14_025380 [Gonioctena quinquepunctata]
MMQDSQKICRLCLMVVSQEIHFIDNIQKDILQITLPDMSIENCDELLMCRLCNELLQEFFKFKSTCLEIEDSIHNYTNEDQFQVDLEKIMGLRELEKDGKICRLCLDFIDGDIFLELSDENCLLVQMVQKCFPEMDLQLTKEPVLCEKCKNMLKKCFTFFSQCMENEYKISNYITTNGANILVLRKALQAISKTKIEFPIIDIMELTNRNTTTMRKISWEIDKTENTSNSDEITEIHLDNISSQKNSPKRNESITKENDIIHILSDHEDSFENSEIEISDDSDIDTSAKDPDYKPDCETEMSDSEKKNK